MDLQGKVAIVTGGGTGIGKEIAKLLAASGAHVVVNYSRSEADALATAKELEIHTVKALPIKADVSSAAEVAALVAQTERALGRIDVLVNNAGYTQFVAMRDVDALSEAVWDRTFDVNVKGIWLCTKAVAPGLVVTRWWGHASEAELNQMRASFPLKRAVEAEEVATAALELIRNDAMTGQTLAQDAGLLLL